MKHTLTIALITLLTAGCTQKPQHTPEEAKAVQIITQARESIPSEAFFKTHDQIQTLREQFDETLAQAEAEQANGNTQTANTLFEKAQSLLNQRSTLIDSLQSPNS